MRLGVRGELDSPERMRRNCYLNCHEPTSKNLSVKRQSGGLLERALYKARGSRVANRNQKNGSPEGGETMDRGIQYFQGASEIRCFASSQYFGVGIRLIFGAR